MPQENRKAFLNNLLQVGKRFVILGAPFYSERNSLAEQIVFEYIRKVHNAQHEQLKEHIDNKLPDAAELKQILEDLGLDFTSFESGNLNSWLLMMITKHYLTSIPDSEQLHNMFDIFYNKSFYESDHSRDCYRNVFIIAAAADNLSNKMKCGEIIICSKKQLAVQAGKGLLEIGDVQIEGKKRMKVEEFLHGTKLQIKMMLGD